MMYLYNIDLDIEWSYHEADGSDVESFCIVAPDAFKAQEKAKKYALSKARGWSDVNDEGKTERNYPVKILDIVKLERDVNSFIHA